MNRKLKNKNQSAFTIVELLVVVAIIGILATIVIIFYIGTHDKAIDGALQADLKGASTVLELDKANGDLYPTTKENANDGKGLKSSDGTTLDYAYSSGDNSYCLTATKEGRSYYINSEGRVPVQGSCPVGNVASFVKTWGGEAEDDWGYSIALTADGGYVMAGSTPNFGAGDEDIFIAKYSSNGNLLWNKTWGKSGEDIATSIVLVNDGGYIITGEASDSGAGGVDVVLLKFSSEGDLIWSKTWGGTGNEWGNGIALTNDGGGVVVGNTNSFGVGSTDPFLIKFTANGDILWAKTWGGSEDEGAESVIVASDGSYVVTGDTNISDTSSKDILLTKLSVGGTVLWSKTWGVANSPEYSASLIEASDNGYVLLVNHNVYHSDIELIKYTSNGDQQWNKTLDGPGTESGYSLAKTSDGGFIITGGTDSFGMGYTDILLAKFTNSGSLSWAKTWGGTGNEYGYDIVQDSDDKFLVSGYTSSYINTGGYADALISKFNSDGSLDNCPVSMCSNASFTEGTITANITAPSMTSISRSASFFNPSILANDLSPTITDVFPSPPPVIMTKYFSSEELYIAYPGESQTACKEWSVPNGYTIKGIQVDQATEFDYDYFTVFLDGVEIYNKSGLATNKYVNTSTSPGNTLKACMSADSSYQEGYGGQVTGVIYN